jgi:hypothetical protein
MAADHQSAQPKRWGCAWVPALLIEPFSLNHFQETIIGLTRRTLHLWLFLVGRLHLLQCRKHLFGRHLLGAARLQQDLQRRGWRCCCCCCCCVAALRCTWGRSRAAAARLMQPPVGGLARRQAPEAGCPWQSRARGVLEGCDAQRIHDNVCCAEVKNRAGVRAGDELRRRRAARYGETSTEPTNYASNRKATEGPSRPQPAA